MRGSTTCSVRTTAKLGSTFKMLVTLDDVTLDDVTLDDLGKPYAISRGRGVKAMRALPACFGRSCG